MSFLRVVAVSCALVMSAAPAALAAGEQTPLELPAAGDGAEAATSAGPGLMRLFVGMFVIVGIVLALRWLLKTYARGKFPGLAAGADAIEVLATKPLAPNRTLHVVRLGDETLLLGATEHAITPLRTIPADEAGRIFPSPDGGFGGALESALSPTPRPPGQRRSQWGGYDQLVGQLRGLTVRRG